MHIGRRVCFVLLVFVLNEIHVGVITGFCIKIICQELEENGAMSHDSSSRSKVYVGDLGYGTTKEELEEKFARYGQLRSVWIARKPPGFAFVEFEDPRDAEDAIRGLSGV